MNEGDFFGAVVMVACVVVVVVDCMVVDFVVDSVVTSVVDSVVDFVVDSVVVGFVFNMGSTLVDSSVVGKTLSKEPSVTLFSSSLKANGGSSSSPRNYVLIKFVYLTVCSVYQFQLLILHSKSNALVG